MIAGKVVGGTIIAVLQSLLFLLLSLTVGVRFSLVDGATLLAFITLAGIGLTCLGVTIAWRLDSTQGFHAIMNLLLMPMWLLSGAFFPVPLPGNGAGVIQYGLHWLMRVNPVTYAVAGIRRLLFEESVDQLSREIWIPSMTTCWLVTIIFCVLIYMTAWRAAGRRIAGDLK